MSRRYGRNQKRAARQALEEVRLDLACQQAAHQMDRLLLKDLSCRLAEARDELDRARRIAGELSILFPATKVTVHGLARDRIELYANRSPLLYGRPDRHISPTEVLRTIPLPLLVQRIDADRLEQLVHARAYFNGGQWRYGITMDAVQAMSTRDLAELLARELGRTMAQDLQAAQQK